jgi:hypothetical protein
LTTLRAPFIIDLMTDPFEYAVDGSPVFYEKWMVDRAFLVLPSVQKVAQYLASTKSSRHGSGRRASPSTK